jgi:hypothetical protein
MVRGQRRGRYPADSSWRVVVVGLLQAAVVPIRPEPGLLRDTLKICDSNVGLSLLLVSLSFLSLVEAVFGTKVTRDGIAKALATFQRTLVAGSSPVDRYLASDNTTLSEDHTPGTSVGRFSSTPRSCGTIAPQ